MAKLRYRKVKVNDLSSGRGQLYHNKTAKKFSESENVDVDSISGRLKLVPDFDSLTKTVYYNYNNDGQHICRQYSGGAIYTFLLLYDSTSTQLKLSRFGASTSEIAVKSFGVAYTEGYYLLAYRDLLIAEYKKSGVVTIAYSSDYGVNFTEATWTYGKIIGHTIDEDYNLVVITADGYIVSTSDGITWTQEYYNANIRPLSINYLDGFTYLIISDKNKLKSRLARISNDDIEILVDLHTEIAPATMIVENEKRLLIAKIEHNQRAYVYEYNKGELSLISFISFSSTQTTIKFLASNNIASYLLIGAKRLYKINVHNGAFLLYNFLDTFEYGQLLNCVIDEPHSHDDGDLRLLFRDTETDDSYYVSFNHSTSNLSGSLTLSIFDLGQHIPAFLIVKHAPLSSTASLVVKARVDKGSSQTTLLTSNVDGAVRTEVNLSELLTNSINYIELELTLNDTGGEYGVSEIELLYLYTPLGLENSK